MRTAAAAGVKQSFPRRPCRKNNVFRRNFLTRPIIPEHNPHAAKNPARQTIFGGAGNNSRPQFTRREEILHCKQSFGGAWRPIIPDSNPHAARNPARQTIFGGAGNNSRPQFTLCEESRTANNLRGSVAADNPQIQFTRREEIPHCKQFRR